MVCPYAVLTELMVYCIPNFTDIKMLLKIRLFLTDVNLLPAQNNRILTLFITQQEIIKYGKP
jgi:hypothetical protein